MIFVPVKAKKKKTAHGTGGFFEKVLEYSYLRRPAARKETILTNR